MSEVRYLVAGDSAVCVEFGNEISPEINKKIRAFKIAEKQSRTRMGRSPMAISRRTGGMWRGFM